ncbi:MAG: cob(I)yrinic acid a,c-diamide adenosyltransferase [Zoogloeaceae bacterium]|jgi:cob(I)alamin adenosyltransferase|nr:cob(I)yrinic acid a,c-diamide adenosyltransferase [Zoogloeaceae bacterium]
MTHRLAKIITRTGDKGQTGLSNGERVAKNDPRIRAIGEIDELNCAIGLLLAEVDLPADARATLIAIQHQLFDLGGELSFPNLPDERRLIRAAHVEMLEERAARLDADLPPLKDFILPGGCRAAALAHLARAICRRAERSLVALAEVAPLSEDARRYINRLSDLLFLFARFLNRAAGKEDVCWVSGDKDKSRRRANKTGSRPAPGAAAF